MTAPATQRLREDVLASLRENGYVVLPNPLQVGQISLDIGLVCIGPPDRLDLAVIVDRPRTREDGLQLYWQIQRLARALDAIGSRRTITVVVIGGFDEPRLLADLQTVSRLLSVDDSLPIRRLLAPLLALELPRATQATLDGIAQVRTRARGRYQESLLRLVDASPRGPDSVKAEYVSWIDSAFPSRGRAPND